MDLFKNMLKDVYRKIDNSNSDFCSTPLANTKKLQNRIAKTIFLAQGNLDDLIANGGKEVDDKHCDERVCTHKHH